VNKTDLINQLAERLDGDKKAAQSAVEGVIDLVQREVQKGRSVSISGFGVFEKRLRAARTARNPRTGEAVKVKKTTVPAFRPGKYFKDVIAGTVKLPKPTGKPTSARAAAAAAKSPAPAAAAKTTTTRAPRAAAAPKAAATAPKTRAAAKPAATSTASPTRTRAAAVKAATTTPAKAATTRAPRATAAKAAIAAAPKAAAAAKPAARRAPAKAKAKV
jgi:DNA-binding protein HU-beta